MCDINEKKLRVNKQKEGRIKLQEEERDDNNVHEIGVGKHKKRKT